MEFGLGLDEWLLVAFLVVWLVGVGPTKVVNTLFATFALVKILSHPASLDTLTC